MRVRSVLVVVALMLPLASAQSQQLPRFNDLAQQLDQADAPRPATGATRTAAPRVQVSYQLQMPADRAASLDDQKAAIASVHAALLDLVAHECERLRGVFGTDCRITTVSIGNMGQPYGNSPAVSATANATFDLSPPSR